MRCVPGAAALLVGQQTRAAVVAGALAAFAPGLARADESAAGGPDDVVVYLLDGRVVRGRLVDMAPGVGMRIRTQDATELASPDSAAQPGADPGADGEVHVIPRQEIMRFERLPVPASASQGAPPEGSPSQASVAQGAAPDRTVARSTPRPTGWVHLEGEGAAVVQRAHTNGTWTGVCIAPCDRALPLDGVYRIDGRGLKTSTPFALRAGPGDYETLRVHGASRGAFTAGVVLLAAGPAAGTGVTLAVVGLHSANGSGPLQGTDRTVVDVSLGAAAASAVIGIGLLILNASTGVSQDVVAPAQPLAPDAAKTPAWSDERAVAGAARSAVPTPAPIFGVPLIAGRF
jgi:hypothetical protein